MTFVRQLSDGRPLQSESSVWRPAFTACDGALDIRRNIRADRMSAYATSVVFSPIAQEATLHVQTASSVKVWFNGQIVYRREVPGRQLSYTEGTARVQLKDGWNTLLAKVVNVRQGYRYGLTVNFSTDENKQSDAK